MENPARILIVEDLATDLDLAQHEIRESLESCVFQHAETQTGFLEALKTFQPDVILADYHLPSFDGLTALGLAVEQAPQTPVIIWTGSRSEETAVECMRAGAANFILKENMKHLGPAVLHALGERRILIERDRAEEKLEQAARNLEMLIESSPVGQITFDPEGVIKSWNPAAEKIYGFSALETIGRTSPHIAPEDRPEFDRMRERVLEGEVVLGHEASRRRKDGAQTFVSLSMAPLRDPEGSISGSMVMVEDITERKRAEEALRIAEEKYRRLVEQIPVAVYTDSGDEFGTKLYLGPQFERITGYPAGDWIGNPDFWAAAIHPDDRERVLEENRRTNVTGERFVVEYRLKKPDGQFVWVREEAVLTSSAGDDSPIWQGTMADISGRKRAEIEGQALLEIMRGLAETEDLQEFMRLVHQSIAQVVYAENFFVVFHNESTGLFEEIYTVDEYDAPAPPSKLEKSLSAYVFRTGEPLLIRRGEFAKLAATGEVELIGVNSASWLGAPIRTRGKSIGVMVIQDYENSDRYSEHDKDFLASIAGQAALAIERKRAEAELRESRAILARAEAMAHLGAWEEEYSASGDPRDNRLHWSDEVYRIFGYEPGKVEPTPELFQEHVHPDDWLVIWRAAERAAVEEGPYAIEFRIIRPDGSQRIVLEHAEMNFDQNGRPVRLIGALQDVTERNLAEQKYQALFENADEGIFQSTQDGRFINMNPAMARIYGYESPEDMIRSVTDIARQIYTAPDEPGSFVGQLGASGVISRVESRNRRKDGSIIWTTISARAVRDSSGNTLYHEGFVQDVTERRRAEEELQERNLLLHEAQKVAGLGQYHLDIETGLWQGSDMLYEILGIEKDYVTDIDGWTKLIHPAERGEMAAYLTQEVIGQRQPFDREYRIVRGRDQQVRWVHGLGRLKQDQAERPIGMIGTIQDITERKEAERTTQRHLAETEALYETTRDLAGERDLPKLLETILQRAMGLLGAAGSGVYLYDPERGDLHLAVVEGDGLSVGTRLERGEGMAGRVAQNRQPMVVDDYQAWAGRSGKFAGGLFRAVLEVPLLDGGELIGVLAVTELGENERKFTDSDVRLLSLFAAHAAGALRNARLLEDLRQRLNELEALYENGLAISQVLEPAEIGRRVIETFSRHLSLHHVAIRLRAHGSDELEVVAFNQPGVTEGERALVQERLNRMVGRVGQGLSGWVVQTSQILRTGNVQAHPQYVNTYPGIRSGLYIPLKVGDRVIGCISVESEQQDAFTVGDERLLSTLGNQAAIAFDNARLYQASLEELAERTRLQAELNVQHAQLKSLLQTIPDPIWLKDPQGNYIVFNPALELMTGQAVTEILGQNDYQLVDQTQAGRFIQKDREAIEHGGPIRYQVWEDYPLGAGHILTEVVKAPMFDSAGDLIGVLGIAHDITELHNAQQELRQSQELYRLLVETSPDAIGMATPDGRLSFANRQAAEIFGYDEPAELVETSPLRLFAAEERPRLIEEFRGISERGSIQNTYWMTRKDGSRFYGEVRASLLRDQAGRPTVLATQMRDITERKNAEDALRESEERMRRLASATFEGVVFSEAGIILEGNEQLARIYGRELSEMIGRPVLEFVATEWKDQVREKIQAGFEGTYEYVALRKDGSRITVEVQSRMLVHKGRPVRVSAIRDITERKRSEAITRQRLTLMEYAEGHSLPDLLQKMVDELCNLTESPIGFFHLVGEDQKSIGLQTWSSRTVAEFCDLAHLEQHYPIDRAGAWADAVRQRKPLIHNNYAALTGRQGQPDGHLMLVREMVIPVVRGEKVVALVGVGNKPHDYAEQDMEVSSRFADYAWDITERTQMEKSLEEERNSLARRVEERTSQLSFVNAELTRASRMKDEFLSTMSHELRTPLNAILSLSESLEEETYGPLTADQASSLKIISESGYHLLGLINDILDVSKIEAGKLGLEIAPVDIDMACHAALRLVRQQAAQKRLKVSYSREADVIGLAADDRRLKQMLVNLLSNAVKFTPEGGEIGLLVSSEAEGEIIRFTVWDTGLGIPHEKLDRLFQPFVQLDSSLSRSHAGTGLGLALVRKLAELHGGGAGVQTEPGHGSRFYFALPAGLDKGDGSAMLAARDPRHAQDDGSLSLPDNEQLGPRLKDFDAQGVCVLVAEDNPVSLTIIRDYLVAHAFRVVAAGNGVEALDRAAEFGPDLILMDIQMPEMDGLEACRRLRAIPRFASVPIVAMTALAMPGDRERCLGAGATDYITKPLSLRALLGTARGLLGSIEAVGGDQNGA